MYGNAVHFKEQKRGPAPFSMHEKGAGEAPTLAVFHQELFAQTFSLRPLRLCGESIVC
jgi:hypothetical protein